MTTLFLDTEYNGIGGDLISLALVDKDGGYWYESLGCQYPTEWVKQHVIPKLDRDAISYRAFRDSLHAFLKGYENPTIVADHAADFWHFFACFKTETFPGLDWACTTVLLAGTHDFHSRYPHNALFDARALRAYYLAYDYGDTD